MRRIPTGLGTYRYKVISGVIWPRGREFAFGIFMLAKRLRIVYFSRIDFFYYTYLYFATFGKESRNFFAQREARTEPFRYDTMDLNAATCGIWLDLASSSSTFLLCFLVLLTSHTNRLRREAASYSEKLLNTPLPLSFFCFAKIINYKAQLK